MLTFGNCPKDPLLFFKIETTETSPGLFQNDVVDRFRKFSKLDEQRVLVQLQHIVGHLSYISRQRHKTFFALKGRNVFTFRKTHHMVRNYLM